MIEIKMKQKDKYNEIRDVLKVLNNCIMKDFSEELFHSFSGWNIANNCVKT